MKKLNLIITLAILLTWIATSAQAHMLWLNASDYTPEAGETVWIEIGWGHKYPRDQVMTEGRLERVYAIDAKGQELPVEKIFPSFYKFTPPTKGAYQIVGKLKSGFLSITTDGHKLGNKKNVSNVVSCFQYLMNAKALIEVGGNKKGFSRQTAEPLEILPLKDPGSLAVGDTLPVKIVFEGKPLAGAKSQCTYTGYEADKEKHWAVEKESDSKGIVQVQLNSKGQWLFKTSHTTPYPDKSEADEYSYRTSLTIGI